MLSSSSFKFFSILELQSVRNLTLESLTNDLYKKFDSSDYFKGKTHPEYQWPIVMYIYVAVGTCIVMLLQNNLLPDPEQRLTAITLLHELYRGESISNTPFASLFLHLLHPPESQSNVGAPKLEYPGQLPRLSPQEKQFISQLISDVPKDVVCCYFLTVLHINRNIYIENILASQKDSAADYKCRQPTCNHCGSIDDSTATR